MLEIKCIGKLHQNSSFCDSNYTWSQEHRYIVLIKTKLLNRFTALSATTFTRGVIKGTYCMICIGAFFFASWLELPSCMSFVWFNENFWTLQPYCTSPRTSTAHKHIWRLLSDDTSLLKWRGQRMKILQWQTLAMQFCFSLPKIVFCLDLMPELVAYGYSHITLNDCLFDCSQKTLVTSR